MATTAVLRVQDVSRHTCRSHQTLESSQSNLCRDTNSAAAAPTSRRRKRKSPPTTSDRDQLVVRSPAAVAAMNMVMEKVKILKRGEPLVPGSGLLGPKPGIWKGLLGPGPGKGLLGPGPGTVKLEKRLKKIEKVVFAGPGTVKLGKRLKKIEKVADEVYSGQGLFTSPPPSCVPYPGFLVGIGNVRKVFRLD